jgi:hypothetical protein
MNFAEQIADAQNQGQLAKTYLSKAAQDARAAAEAKAIADRSNKAVADAQKADHYADTAQKVFEQVGVLQELFAKNGLDGSASLESLIKYGKDCLQSAKDFLVSCELDVSPVERPPIPVAPGGEPTATS